MAKKGSKTLDGNSTVKLLTGQVAYRGSNKLQENPRITPAIMQLTNLSNLASQSFDADTKFTLGKLAYDSPEKALFASLKSLSKIDPIVFIGGFGILPLLNIFQIWVMSILEYCFRSAGALLVFPASKISSNVAKIGYMATPVGAIGQSLNGMADVTSSIRQLLDSLNYLINGGWWGSKAFRNATKTPSMKHVFKNFAGALANLIIPSILMYILIELPNYLKPTSIELSTALAITSLYTTALLSMANQFTAAVIQVTYNKEPEVKRERNTDLIHNSQAKRLSSQAAIQLTTVPGVSLAQKDEKEEKTPLTEVIIESVNDASLTPPNPPMLTPPDLNNDDFLLSVPTFLFPGSRRGSLEPSEKNSRKITPKNTPTKTRPDSDNGDYQPLLGKESLKNRTPSKLFNPSPSPEKKRTADASPNTNAIAQTNNGTPVKDAVRKKLF